MVKDALKTKLGVYCDNFKRRKQIPRGNLWGIRTGREVCGFSEGSNGVLVSGGVFKEKSNACFMIM